MFKFIVSAFAVFLSMIGMAQAALPPEVLTSITEAQTDGQTLGYAMLGMAVLVGVVFWLKRRAG